MGVFICYRREDSEGEARALFTMLSQVTDQSHLFLDHEAIGIGDDWKSKIDATLDKVQAVLIVIGPRWLAAIKERADAGASDPVRHEIAAALNKHGMKVIPVTVNGARLPGRADLPEDIRSLTDRNAVDLRGPSWTGDTARLIATLRKAGALPTARRTWLWRAAGAASIVAVAVGMFMATVRVPNVPIGMGRDAAQEFLAQHGLELVPVNLPIPGNRGVSVTVRQVTPPDSRVMRGSKLEVEFQRSDGYYRLVCKAGGGLAKPAENGVLSFARYDGAITPQTLPSVPAGSCAWLTGGLHPNQETRLKPLGFLERLQTAFDEAPGRVLVLCAHSEYDVKDNPISQRLAAINYKKLFILDDAGKLVPNITSHVCDDED